MTNEEMLEDLKQYIDTRVPQIIDDRVKTIIDERVPKIVDERVTEIVDVRISQTEQKLTKHIADVDAKADTILETMGGQLVDHENRITRLEQTAA